MEENCLKGKFSQDWPDQGFLSLWRRQDKVINPKQPRKRLLKLI